MLRPAKRNLVLQLSNRKQLAICNLQKKEIKYAMINEQIREK